MDQVRDAIEYGEVTDEAGNRWAKYRPGDFRTVIADEAETRAKLDRLKSTERRYTVCLLVFAAASFVFGTACWYFLLTWLKA